MGTWEYDALGQLIKSVAGGTCYAYECRPDGKLLRKWDSGKLVLACDYYREGSLKSLTDLSGHTTIYEYDRNRRLSCLKDGDGIVMAGYRYTAGGRVSSILTMNGLATRYRYDSDGNLSGILLENRKKKEILYSASLYYDLCGNRTGRSGLRLKDGDGTVMAGYSYTDGGRVSSISTMNGLTTRYRYDSDGNLSGILLENRKKKEILYSASLYHDLCGNRTGRSGLRLGADGKQYQLETTFRYDAMNVTA